MFEDLGMIEKWKIPKEVLVRWVMLPVRFLCLLGFFIL